MKEKSTRSNRIRNITLTDLFGREIFADLQRKLSQVTDFSFSTIDYRGKEIAGHCYQKKYENMMLESEDEESCQLSSAVAAAKSAITNMPYIYLCQCGLVKIAVPVIVDEQYLGAVICGGVRCSDPDYVDPETGYSIVNKELTVNETEKDQQLISQMPAYSALKIKSVADLVFFIIKEMCQKESYAIALGNEEHNQVHLKDIRSKNEELRKRIHLLEQDALKAKLYPQTLLNMLSTVSSMAILENSILTQEVVETLSGILRHYIEYTREYIPLDKELEQIANYLEVIKLRYDNRIQIKAKVSPQTSAQTVPKLILFPLVDYISNMGVLNRNFKGILTYSVDFISGRCIIAFDLKRSEDIKSKMGYFKDAGSVTDERFYTEQIIMLEERLKSEYKDNYKLSVELDHIVLDLPQTIHKSRVKN